MTETIHLNHVFPESCGEAADFVGGPKTTTCPTCLANLRTTGTKPMTMNDYQRLAEETAQYPTLGHPIVYPALGLAGEAGEVAEKVKKAMRDDYLVITDDRKAELNKELGDVLWYVSETARQAGLTLEEVAAANYFKLKDRKERGMING